MGKISEGFVGKNGVSSSSLAVYVENLFRDLGRRPHLRGFTPA
jgi:hypothetical protein